MRVNSVASRYFSGLASWKPPVIAQTTGPAAIIINAVNNSSTGASTDSTERGRMMWARVKGRTENALLRCGFKGAYMFRPGAIIPMHGIRSATEWYNTMYAIAKPLIPVLRRLSPTSVTTTEQVGRAMISVARNGYSKPILEMRDITRF